MALTPNTKAASYSKTITDTVVGEHQHVIVGYSLVKGIGDGEPIASERFTVGGHEWVLLFYPDGKRSSSAEGHIDAHGPGGGQLIPAPQPAPAAGPGQPGAGGDAGGDGQPLALPPPGAAPNPPVAPGAAHHQVQQLAALPRPQAQRRDTTNEYAALFVALIGEGSSPQGIVNTSEGKVVRAFHRFTLVDQTGQGRDLTKGRTRDAGAVKISCARQDPNARNCHGYRKFVKRTILEDPTKGYLLNDTIIIKYTIELVVSTGGALSRNTGSKTDLVKVPPPSMGADLGKLLSSGTGVDYTFIVEEEEMKVHKIILEARSPVFKALLNTPMREGQEGRVVIGDMKAAVFNVLLHYVYTDSLPEEHDGSNLDVAMAQHLLVAADRYELIRLRRICERRLCETVDVETVATTLTLAEQNHADELKKVCLDFVSRNLAAVMATDGYRHMTVSCQQLQAEILQTIATTGGTGYGERGHGSGNGHRAHGAVRPRDYLSAPEDANPRRVRARLE